MTGYTPPSLRIEDNGAPVPEQPFVNFKGAGVTTVDNPGVVAVLAGVALVVFLILHLHVH